MCPPTDAGTLKIDGSKLVEGYDDGLIAITARGGDPDAFSWTLLDIHTVDIQAVIVKGGDAAYIYYYADDNDDSDENLTPPVNNGGRPQISHVEFCFDPKDASNPSSPSRRRPAARRIQHSWSIDKQVKVAGRQPVPADLRPRRRGRHVELGVHRPSSVRRRDGGHVGR